MKQVKECPTSGQYVAVWQVEDKIYSATFSRDYNDDAEIHELDSTTTEWWPATKGDPLNAIYFVADKEVE